MTPSTPAIANTASQRVGSLMRLRPRLLALWLCGALAPSRVNPSSLWGEPVFEEGGGNKETAALPTLRPRSAEGPVHPPHFERTERPREKHFADDCSLDPTLGAGAMVGIEGAVPHHRNLSDQRAFFAPDPLRVGGRPCIFPVRLPGAALSCP